MSFRQQRHDALDGGYRIVVWDDACGQAAIFEYDAADALQRRGVITHFVPVSVDGLSGEVVWHGPDGAELGRRPLHEGETAETDAISHHRSGGSP